jgi:hypothetical protein
MSLIATSIVLFLFCSVAKVAWAGFKFLFVLVAFIALLHGRDHQRGGAEAVPASSYGRY